MHYVFLKKKILSAHNWDAPSLSTAYATFKVILGFINMGMFFGSPVFFSSSWLGTTHSVKSIMFGATVGWQRAR